MAAMALEHLSRLQFAIGAIAAAGTAEALRPAQLEQRLSAGFLGAVLFEKLSQAETFLELNRILWHIVTSCFFGGYDVSTPPSQ